MAGKGKKSKPRPARPGAIRRRNVAKILKAAETVFAQKGFSGASTAEIARLAGVPKPNLHYYFRTKQALYESLLDRILAMWMDAMDELHPGADPAEALSRYVARKIDLSRRLPGPSRLWAMEMLAGAPHIGGFLRGRVRELVNEKSALVATWIEAGRISPIAPAHLFFIIWAATQTYADFAAQMTAVMNRKTLDGEFYDAARDTLTSLILNGLGLKR
ncbi:MAG TPA: TetR/AcrR family transcriptional regulator [Stellaceae bacterium]|nr:TetR/AcrR family transcriptional regulator [Stellaceae bacterium]